MNLTLKYFYSPVLVAVKSTLVRGMTHLTAPEEDLLLEFWFDSNTMAMLAKSTHCLGYHRSFSLCSWTHQQRSKGRKFFASGFMDVFRVIQEDFWQCAVPGSQAPSCWYFLELEHSGSGLCYCVVLRKRLALGPKNGNRITINFHLR